MYCYLQYTVHQYLGIQILLAVAATNAAVAVLSSSTGARAENRHSIFSESIKQKSTSENYRCKMPCCMPQKKYFQLKTIVIQELCS